MTVNVLFDYQIFFHQEYGGISRYVIELARGLRAMPGVGVSLYGGRHHNAYLEEAASELPVRGHRVPRHASKLRHGLSLMGNAAEFFVQASRERPTHIHQTYYYELLRPLGGAAQILTVYDMTHELYPDQTTSPGRVSRAKRRAVARADHVISISESTKRDLVRLFDVPPEKVTVIPLSFAPALLEARSARARPLDRPYVLFVGKRDGYKNFPAFLEAYASSATLRGQADMLCFGGGPLSKSERELQARLGLTDGRVHQVNGGDGALAAAYQHAEFLVYPSLYEGFGLPLLEAMALGCPVACSNNSSLPEVVGDAALSYDPTSVEQITAAIDRLAGDSALRESCRAAGLARAATFSWQRCAEQTLALYRRVS
jgi:glycosyltransferase involved in cell wall biosynthesis